MTMIMATLEPVTGGHLGTLLECTWEPIMRHIKLNEIGYPEITDDYFRYTSLLGMRLSAYSDNYPYGYPNPDHTDIRK